MIYFDNAASTKPRQEVIDEMSKVMNEQYANMDAIHSFAYDVLKEMQKKKQNVFKKIGIDAKNVYFTSGGSDGNNIIIQGIVNANMKFKNHIITTKIEHPSVYEVFRHYENNGITVDYLGVDKNGRIDLEELKSKITVNTMLVSISAVNSEIGIIQNIEEISKIIKEKNKDTYFHTDFVQGTGHVKIDFSNKNIDAITFSGHKIYAPKGIGAIYVKENVKIKETVFGTNQENGIVRRTMPTELIMAFLKAMEMIVDNIDKEIRYLKEIKEYCALKLEENIENIKINSLLDINEASPSILNVSFIGVKGEVLTHFLSMHKIYVSTGSACSTKKGNSRVLEQLHLTNEEVDGGIRFSFSIYNTKEEIDESINIIKTSVEQIRKMK